MEQATALQLYLPYPAHPLPAARIGQRARLPAPCASLARPAASEPGDTCAVSVRSGDTKKERKERDHTARARAAHHDTPTTGNSVQPRGARRQRCTQLRTGRARVIAIQVSRRRRQTAQSAAGGQEGRRPSIMPLRLISSNVPFRRNGIKKSNEPNPSSSPERLCSPGEARSTPEDAMGRHTSLEQVLPVAEATGRRPSMSLQVTDTELEDINSLINASSRDGLKALRERRNSKAHVVVPVAAPEQETAVSVRPQNDEVKMINELIKNDGQYATTLKERRKSLSGAPSIHQENKGTDSFNGEDQLGHLTSPSTPDEAPQPSSPKQRWKDAMLAVSVQAANTEKLTGAAARGAKAAALTRVRSAVSSCGGVFLTQEQWEAMRSENSTLKTANKRLEKELQDARRVMKSSPQTLGDTSPACRRVAKSKAFSPMIQRAFASPLGQRSYGSPSLTRMQISAIYAESPSC